MSPKAHKIYINTLISIVVICTIYLFINGISYYFLSTELRVEHPDHKILKPSGMIGHGLGIVGTLLILIGVFGYMARKRFKKLARIGVLKYWLEFHIFLCTLGPIMILFHTAFKFGGIVSISFWSMVAVVASGVAGRFIYRQIPRTIQGRALSLLEIQEIKNTIQSDFKQVELSKNIEYDLIPKFEYQKYPQVKSISLFRRLLDQYQNERAFIKNIKIKIENSDISVEIKKKILDLSKQEISLSRKIENLGLMQKLFKYWHVAHLPFAIIMLIIMVIHVLATMTFA